MIVDKLLRASSGTILHGNRSFDLLLVAVGGVTATNNNQRHHDNANNAEQLLHKILLNALKVIVGSAYSTATL
jgi:hypothetical protein